MSWFTCWDCSCSIGDGEADRPAIVASSGEQTKIIFPASWLPYAVNDPHIGAAPADPSVEVGALGSDGEGTFHFSECWCIHSSS